jgi:DeoR family glycerol-3-phosphate regulon repressor
MADLKEQNDDRGPVLLSMRLRVMAQLLRERGVIGMQDVMDTFGVARATAQRDLDRLCDTTDAQRTRGGAILPDDIISPRAAIDLSLRKMLDVDAKMHIAALAVTRLAGSSSLYLDAGTTTLQVAEEIVRSNWRPVWVVTNDWHIAEILARAGIRHEILGGEVDAHSLAISGPTAIETISRFHFDWAVLSGDAITADGSVRAALPPEAQLKRTAIKTSSKAMLLAPAAKFEKSAHVEVASLSDFDVWITDVSDSRIEVLCRACGVEMVCLEQD